ncbi:MAG TPA: LuxR C-terminal-related transcriptional regulator [Bacteroidota bacterium]
MRNTILIYSFGLAGLLALLKLIEYQFLARNLSLEIYVGLIAVFFTGLGIWAGLRLTRRKTPAAGPDFKVNEDSLRKAGISAREYEVLTLIARGLSNQEIADALFVSLSTVKTHSSNLFQKLGATRRTQALQKGRDLGLLP